MAHAHNWILYTTYSSENIATRYHLCESQKHDVEGRRQTQKITGCMILYIQNTKPGKANTRCWKAG